MSTMTNPYAPPKATVRDINTPMSQVSLVYADRGTRLGAAIVDTIIAMAMIYLPVVIFLIAGVAIAPAGEGLNAADASSVLVLIGFGLGFVGLVVWCWLTYKYVAENGQTIAKRWLQIKVVRSDGSPASVARIFWLRNAVNMALGIVPLYGLIDPLFIFSESQQCLHDKIADTIVIKA